VHQRFGADAVFLFCAALALAWFVVASPMGRPRRVSSQVIRVGALSAEQSPGLQRRLLEVPGVEEAVVVTEEGLAYLKVDNRRLDWARLQEFSARA
jgi:hypothetical protein